MKRITQDGSDRPGSVADANFAVNTILSLTSFHFSYPLLHLNDTIGIQRNCVNPRFHQEGGEVGVVAGSLTADADFATCCVGAFDQAADHALDGWVALVK